MLPIWEVAGPWSDKTTPSHSRNNHKYLILKLLRGYRFWVMADPCSDTSKSYFEPSCFSELRFYNDIIMFTVTKRLSLNLGFVTRFLSMQISSNVLPVQENGCKDYQIKINHR